MGAQGIKHIGDKHGRRELKDPAEASQKTLRGTSCVPEVKYLVFLRRKLFFETPQSDALSYARRAQCNRNTFDFNTVAKAHDKLLLAIRGEHL